MRRFKNNKTHNMNKLYISEESLMKGTNGRKIVVMILIGLFCVQLTTAVGGTTTQTTLVFEGMEVRTTVHETLAETNMSFTFKNNVNESLQSYVTVDIPKGAYVTNLSLVRNNNTYWGTVLEKQEAEQSFENATSEGRSAILLTQLSKQSFLVDFSVEALGEVTIGFYYTQRLVRYLGTYELLTDLDVGLTPETWSFEAFLVSPTRSVATLNAPDTFTTEFLSAKEAVVRASGVASDHPSSPVFITYDLLGDAVSAYAYDNGTREFFATTFSPQLESSEGQLGKDFVFLIDNSGSMGTTKMDQAKNALVAILNNLYYDDRVGVIRFSTNTASGDHLINASDSQELNSLKSWVSAIYSNGGTNIYAALQDGLAMFDTTSTRPKVLVLLTDGVPTAGVTNKAAIEENFANDNAEVGASLFTLGFGNDVDFPFLQRLARGNGGDGVAIPEGDAAEEYIGDFYAMISTPLVSGLTVIATDGVVGNLYPYFLPNLYEGSELFLVGLRDGDLNITINGTTTEGPQTWQILLTSNSSTAEVEQWVEQLWAITKIDDLLTQISYTSGDISSLRQQVLDLALFYGVVCDYTAMFVEVPEEDEVVTDPEDTGDDPGDGDDYVPASQTQTQYTNAAQTTYYATETQAGGYKEALRDDAYGAASPGFEFFVVIVLLGTLVGLRKRR